MRRNTCRMREDYWNEVGLNVVIKVQRISLMMMLNGNGLVTNIELKIVADHIIHAKNEIGTEIVGDKSIYISGLGGKLNM